MLIGVCARQMRPNSKAVAFCGETMPGDAIWERAAIYRASHSNERIRRLEKFKNWVLEIHR